MVRKYFRNWNATTTNCTTNSNDYDENENDSINNNFMKNKIKGPVSEI